MTELPKLREPVAVSEDAVQDMGCCMSAARFDEEVNGV